jgi:heme-degrading monooxygenase HmoA
LVIARIWRGVTPRSKSRRYLQYLKASGVKDYRRTPGNLGVTILVRHSGDETEFVVISLWKSMNAIRKFAGDDVEKARYYPEDREFLLELEPKVKHYNIGLQAR